MGSVLCGVQVELFCISKLINCMLDADEEFVYMDCHFAIGEHAWIPFPAPPSMHFTL